MSRSLMIPTTRVPATTGRWRTPVLRKVRTASIRLAVCGKVSGDIVMKSRMRCVPTDLRLLQVAELLRLIVSQSTQIVTTYPVDSKGQLVSKIGSHIYSRTTPLNAPNRGGGTCWHVCPF